MMSRKNYNVLAEMFGEAHAVAILLKEDDPKGAFPFVTVVNLLQSMRHNLILHLQDDNPKFDLARFDDAITAMMRRVIAQNQLPEKTPY